MCVRARTSMCVNVCFCVHVMRAHNTCRLILARDRCICVIFFGNVIRARIPLRERERERERERVYQRLHSHFCVYWTRALHAEQYPKIADLEIQHAYAAT